MRLGDLAAAHAMILAERAARIEAETKLADLSSTEALITYYKLEIEKLRHQLYGAWMTSQSSATSGARSTRRMPASSQSLMTF